MAKESPENPLPEREPGQDVPLTFGAASGLALGVVLAMVAGQAFLQLPWIQTKLPETAACSTLLDGLILLGSFWLTPEGRQQGILNLQRILAGSGPGLGARSIGYMAGQLVFMAGFATLAYALGLGGNGPKPSMNGYDPHPQEALLSILATPVLEELLFRGIILRRLLCRYEERLAIIGSGALFAVLHFDPGNMVYLFLGGTYLGWVYARTRSLWVCVACHALNNLLFRVAILL